MKVHITLTEQVRANEEEKLRALEKIESEGALSGVNMPRFRRYGIVTGDIPPDRLDRVRALACVQSVNTDSIQRALVEKPRRSSA